MVENMTKTKKMPEPFVALREDERKELGVAKWTPSGILGPRDKRGVYWCPYGGSMTGETLFSQIHPVRHKMCMEGPYCQVCGTRLQPNRTPWILNGSGDPTVEELSNLQPFDTITPPTCQNCQQVARQVCPHLLKKGDTPRLLVKSFRIWGVYGDFHYDADPEKSERGIVVRFGTTTTKQTLPFLVAKQLVVEINRYRVLNAP